jgi:flagellar hook-length control protein FliK
MEDFRNVLGEVSRATAPAAARVDELAPARDDAPGRSDIPVPTDAAPAHDPATHSGIQLLLQGAASARPMNMPGLDETVGYGTAAKRDALPTDGFALQSPAPPGPAQADAAELSAPDMGDGRSGSAADTLVPPATDGPQAQALPVALAVAGTGSDMAGVSALAAAMRQDPDSAPVGLPAGNVRSGGTDPVPLAAPMQQGSQQATAHQAAVSRAQPGLRESGSGTPAANDIDLARQMGRTEEGSTAIPRPAEHQAGSLTASMAWLERTGGDHAGSDHGGARTPAADAAPHAFAANASIDASAAGRAGALMVTDVRPGHFQPERVLDIPQHPASMPWREQFVDRVRFLVSDRTQTAELRLHPAELGPVSIQISIAEQQASIIFLAAHEDTRRHIVEALPQLRDMLGESGVRLGNTSVDDHPHPQFGQSEARARHAPATATEDAPARMAAGLEHHLIDTYA